MKSITKILSLILLVIFSIPFALNAQGNGLEFIQAVSGDLVLQASSNGDEVIHMIDTSTGLISRTISDGNFGPEQQVWDSEGEKLAYSNAFQVSNWFDLTDQTFHVVESLPNAEGSFNPIGWASDGSSILYLNVIVGTESIKYNFSVFDTSQSTLQPIKTYETGIVNGIPYPKGNNNFNLYDIYDAERNPVRDNWVSIAFRDEIIQDDSSIKNIIAVLWNIETDQMLSFNSIIDNSLNNTTRLVGNIKWSSDGRYLLLDAYDYVNQHTQIYIIHFTEDNQLVLKGYSTFTDNLVRSVDFWLGTGNLFVTRMHDRETSLTTFKINELYDGVLHETDFIKINTDTLNARGDSAWYLRADEAEKRELSCLFDQTLPPQLTVGTRGRVTITDGTPTRLRASWGTDAAEITQMPEGTAFDVIEEPTCADGYRWWKLRLSDGTEGYAAEASTTEYFLEPLATAAPPTSNPGVDQTVISSNGISASVTLDGSGSSDPDGTIVSYEWKEGDTTIATGVNPTVELSAGVHEIYLTITDDSGLSAVSAAPVTITVTYPPMGAGWMLFVSDRPVGGNAADVDNEIYAYNPAAGGSDVVQLTNNTSNERRAIWSPDRTMVLFESTMAGSNDLWILDVTQPYQENVNPFRLDIDDPTSEYHDRQPAWSSSGNNRIAFASDRSGNFDIYYVRFDTATRQSTGGAKRATTSTAKDAQPDWDPTGTKIVYSVELAAEDLDLRIAHITSGCNDTCTTTDFITGTTSDSQPVWSPLINNKSYIAFSTTRAGGDLDVYYVEATNGVLVGTPKSLTNNTVEDSFLAWDETFSTGTTGISFLFQSNRQLSGDTTNDLDIYKATVTVGNTNPTATRLPFNTDYEEYYPDW